jgi:hypothetical protein
VTGCPVPPRWLDAGAPASAVAAYAEGCCPVHGVPLDAGMVQFGAKAGCAYWLPAGWCGRCAAWWHWSEPGEGLGVTWDMA